MKKFLILLTLCCTAITANASLITIDIEDKVYEINNTLTANIYISDFNAGLSGFALDLITADNLLAFEKVNFGTKLDLFFPGVRFIDNFALNRLSISELSFDLPFDLEDAQLGLDKILLASVDFNVVGLGLASFSLENYSAGDVFSFLYQGIISDGASVQLGSEVSVPEPSSIAIFALAIMLLLGSSRLRKS